MPQILQFRNSMALTGLARFASLFVSVDVWLVESQDKLIKQKGERPVSMTGLFALKLLKAKVTGLLRLSPSGSFGQT